MFKIIQRLLRTKYIFIVLIITLLSGAAGSLYNIMILNRQKSMVIEFNYPGAERGLNPDGSVFEIAELKSAEVIDKARENLKDQSIDAEFLRSRIFITSKFTSSSYDRIISAIHNEQNMIYMPTTFYVYYSQKNKFSKNESDIFMENLAKAYTDYFTEKYTEKNDVLIFDPDVYDFPDKDYLEIYTIFKNKADEMYTYISHHQNENRAFYSEDKINLGMAAKMIESFRDINLEKFYAYIVQNSVSKDNKDAKKRLEYLISETQVDYEKLNNSSAIASNALENYGPNVGAVAYIPSINSKGNYYMSRTKTGLDILIKQSYDNGILASKKIKDIEYYQGLYNKFAAVELTDLGKLVRAEEMMQTLESDLKRISEEVLKTDNEYLEHKTQNYFNIRLPKKSIISVTLVIKFMILGFMFGLCVVIFLEFFEKYFKKKFGVLSKSLASMKLLDDKEGE